MPQGGLHTRGACNVLHRGGRLALGCGVVRRRSTAFPGNASNQKKMMTGKTWGTHLDRPISAQDGRPLFDADFLDRWRDRNWNPEPPDENAARELHTELNSRITIQPLRYSDGDDATALRSVYDLFAMTRGLVAKYPECGHFEETAMHVLNRHVRPFTARWHRRNLAGALKALDNTDEFRADLDALRPVLIAFDRLLLEMCGREQPAPSQIRQPHPFLDEMKHSLSWGIRETGSPNGGVSALEINKAEKTFIQKRRRANDRPAPADPCDHRERQHAAGIALSGGGIRSATFSLGVLTVLAKRDVLRHVDYLSTVSGGGYLGAFLAAFLSGSAGPGIGLKTGEAPLGCRGRESDAIRHIRHHCRYLLTGSVWGRVQIAFAQLHGLTLNALAIGCMLLLLALGERAVGALRDAVSSAASDLAPLVWLVIVPLAALLYRRCRMRERTLPDQWGTPEFMLLALFSAALLVGGNVAIGTAGMLLLGVVTLPLLSATQPDLRPWADRMLALLGLPFAALGGGALLSALHPFYGAIKDTSNVALVLAGMITVAGPVFLVASGRAPRPLRQTLTVLASLSAPTALLIGELAIYDWLTDLQLLKGVHQWSLVLAMVPVGIVTAILLGVVNVNFTSLHRHYRDKLAGTFLIRHSTGPGARTACEPAGRVLLSSLYESYTGPYPLFNGALNVPGSRVPGMQGRHTDLFLFSPAYCGSQLTGYEPTKKWEDADDDLDLATAMAISGAAVSPQMGLATSAYLRFWLALLNIRLGYWVHSPFKKRHADKSKPNLKHLFQEMLGSMDEAGSHFYVSDGGHIENLGVYELLRRRCKYIIAVDGEQDSGMTFHALANLQRMSKSDLGIDIQINVDDLRLNTEGVCRSHFAFCRILYSDSPREVGYLLYVKLSLTGNEGEFIRRYKMDEPEFPHHSTADQFFTESQFEAYRALGEHIGEKLFSVAILGTEELGGCDELEEWFFRLGSSLLEPVRVTTAPMPLHRSPDEAAAAGQPPEADSA